VKSACLHFLVSACLLTPELLRKTDFNPHHSPIRPSMLLQDDLNAATLYYTFTLSECWLMTASLAQLILLFNLAADTLTS
jgi:hypothetical protein